MSSRIEALIVEFDEEAPQEPSQPAGDESWGKKMEFDIDAEVAKRQNAIRRILAKTDPERINAGIEAYKRELPKLLQEGKDRQVVAYDGDKCVGIAQTLDELNLRLKQDGIHERANLFIKHILPLDDGSEHFHPHSR